VHGQKKNKKVEGEGIKREGHWTVGRHMGILKNTHGGK